MQTGKVSLRRPQATGHSQNAEAKAETKTLPHSPILLPELII
jgi:hypothetical protein